MQVAAYARALANPRLLAVLLFGFASGLPLALTGQALQAWLTVDGVDLTTIGLFALVGQPYAFKFLWAPLMDRFEPPWLGRRRGWLVLCQVLLAGLILLMSTLDVANHVLALGVLATLTAFLSASQDVVVDAYRTEIAAQDERGIAAAVGVLGYRLAMLVSGGFAFLLASTSLGWPGTYRLMAFTMLAVALYTCISPRIAGDEHKPASGTRHEFAAFAAMITVAVLGFWVCWYALGHWLTAGGYVQQLLGLLLPTVAALLLAALVGRILHFSAASDVLGFGGMAIGIELGLFAGRGVLLLLGFSPESESQWHELLFIVTEILFAVPAALLAARLARFRLLIEPMRAYFTRQHAWAFLGLIILYKLGDAFAGTLTTSFLLKGAGFSLTEVGVANKVVGLFATLVGAVVGGLLMVRLGLWRSLLAFGVLQGITNLGYWWLAMSGKGAMGVLQLNIAWMTVFFGGKGPADVALGMDVLLILSVLIENLAGGMGTAALVAFLMALCSDRHATATQFALLSALAALGRVYVGPTSGYLAKAWGWPDFFLFSLLVALPGLILLLFLRRAVQSLEQPDPDDKA